MAAFHVHYLYNEEQFFFMIKLSLWLTCPNNDSVQWKILQETNVRWLFIKKPPNDTHINCNTVTNVFIQLKSIKIMIWSAAVILIQGIRSNPSSWVLSSIYTYTPFIYEFSFGSSGQGNLFSSRGNTMKALIWKQRSTNTFCQDNLSNNMIIQIHPRSIAHSMLRKRVSVNGALLKRRL